jgi:hypothetical protein
MKEKVMTEYSQICIATYADEMSAEVARMSLESAGIPAFVSKDDCGGMQPNLKMITKIRLMINAADEKEAQAILNHTA